MEQLRVIGTEGETLVLATESGERFTLPVDDVLRAQLRQARRERDEDHDRGPRTSPREIQAQIRAGLGAREVAELFGISIDVVSRYEGPVLAEREHIVGQALAVPVLVADDFEHDTSPTFGTAVRAKLAEAHASGERWTSWKEEGGWIVKLEFAVGEVEHDARWSFDPRRTTLTPANAAATQLSRQGALPEGLIPRLRALEVPLPPAADVSAMPEPGPRRLTDADIAAASVQEAAVRSAPSDSTTSGDTADLLEALRRRRGQREPLPLPEDDDGDTTPTLPVAPVSIFDAFGSADAEPASGPADDELDILTDEPAARTGSTPGDSRRKGRTSMPSWDEIVFGARSEDS
ncbi:MAG TPA: septation protein SepH [Microbacterium sp.]|nr:septation protein SepH [Microbacterium sp.]